jgi:hypothetical protein
MLIVNGSIDTYAEAVRLRAHIFREMILVGPHAAYRTLLTEFTEGRLYHQPNDSADRDVAYESVRETQDANDHLKSQINMLGSMSDMERIRSIVTALLGLPT